MNSLGEDCLYLLVMVCICAVCLAGVYFFLSNGFAAKQFNDPLVVYEGYDVKYKLGCSSDSMGLSLNCGDVQYSNFVNSSSYLETGEIYVYKRDNKSIVHRLVYCLDSDCNSTIFKGDNNEVAELVNRSEIVAKVVMVEYK